MQDADIVFFPPAWYRPDCFSACHSRVPHLFFFLSPRGVGESPRSPEHAQKVERATLRGGRHDRRVFVNNELTWRRRRRGHSFVLAFIWGEKQLPAAVRGDVHCFNESSQPLIITPVRKQTPSQKKPEEIPQKSGSMCSGWRDSV